MAGNKASGRHGVIDNHPEKTSIIKDIVLGRRSLTDIARRIGTHPDTVRRYRDTKITEETRRRIIAENRIEGIEADTAIVNEERMDVARDRKSVV